MTSNLVETAYALAVCGAALLHPALGLLVAAAFLVGLAVVHDRRTPPA